MRQIFTKIVKPAKYIILAGTILFLLHTVVFLLLGLHDNISKAGAIVVFGNTVNRDGTLSNRLKSRLDKSLEIFRSSDTSYIIVSGAVGKEGHDEAQVMKQYLMWQGVPSNKILQDSRGYNTLATANNTKKILEENQLHSVILVSQYFHIARAEYTFKKIGINEVYHAHANIFEWRDIYSLPREVFAFYAYLIN